jgi:hypothetical protein
VAKNLKLIKVFVASPGDCIPERKRLDKAVREVNLANGDTVGLRLELVGWETHTHPGFGTDLQAVINEQIGNDYDVFVGLLWSKLGTPTPRHPSGTIEEFSNLGGHLKSRHFRAVRVSRFIPCRGDVRQ